MAKIDRFDGNLQAFASQAQGTERTVFGDTVQSDTLDANITADWLRGWGIVGVNENPTKQDFNGLAFTLGQLLAYLHQMGVPEWNVNQEYQIGSVATTPDGVYRSLIADNVGIDPDTDDGTNWEKAPTQAEINNRVIRAGSVADLAAISNPQEGWQALVSGSPYRYDGADWVEQQTATPEAFGAKHSDPAFDNFPAIKQAFESGVAIVFPKGKTYHCLTTGEIYAPSISAYGNGSVLAFDPALAKGLHIQGNVVGETTLSADAGLFDPTVTVASSAGITAGTYLIMRDTTAGSFSGYRPEYTKGDILRVRSVSGNTVVLDGFVETDVLAVNSQVVIVAPVKLDMSGLEVTKLESGAGQALWLDYLWDSTVKSVKGTHGSVSARLKHVLDSDIFNLDADNTVATTESDGYGISYLGCKNVNQYGGLARTVNNHACDFSSGVAYNIQSRNVVVHDAVLLGGSWAASYHGDSENCRYVGCTADGVIMGGLQPKFTGGTVLLNVERYFDSGVTQIPAVRLTEMLTADFDFENNSVIVSHDNKDPSTTIYFVQTIGGNMIGSDAVDGGIINISGNTFRYIGDRDANTDGDFFAFQLGAAVSAAADVRDSTDIVFEKNTIYLGDSTFVTAYQFTDFNDGFVEGNSWMVDEADIRRRLIQSLSGNIQTDEKMGANLTANFGVEQTLTSGVETTLYESTGTESAFEIASGVVTGKNLQIRGYSDGELVFNPGQGDPRGQVADGSTTVSVYSIPRITGAKSVRVTAEAYGGGDRVCGWNIVHKS